MRAHPDNRKMKVEKFFPCFAQRDHPYAPLATAFGSGRTTPNTSRQRYHGDRDQKSLKMPVWLSVVVLS